ncbi:MAG: hypothetical protein ABH875_07230 [Candidatus Omnitrophota bacterium]
MAKKSNIALAAILALVLGAALVGTELCAKEEADAAPGMEIVTVGDTKLMVPKGTKVHERDGMIVVESVGAYAERKLTESEDRVNSIKASMSALQEKLEKLKETAADLQEEAQKVREE